MKELAVANVNGEEDYATEGGAELPPHLRALNPAQLEAVEATDGPVLVLAGAGTGKTRVLTSRLAHLIYTGRAAPAQIMAVTFTNKAAAEIRERVSAVIGRPVEGWFLGTFHSLAARLLRPHAERVGLKSSFTILDTDDQMRLIKQILQAENIDEKKSPPRAVLAVISRWKDRGLLPRDARDGGRHTLADGKLESIYSQYQQRLQDLNACDFGDLIMHQLTLLRENPDVLAQYHDRFAYLMVDEYQDTNVAQYLWLRLLAQARRNICCVGDEDQSIYGWRGAEIGNILRFEEDFPGAKVIRLEDNYRSTGNILGAASRLIANNRMRLGKTLRTAADAGEKIQVRGLWDGGDEAQWVADEIESLAKRGAALGQIAVMVRAGFQTRLFEEKFIRAGIPYRVLVGARFYERQEIRDALAYLRLVMSGDDDLAFERVINLPKRGVGPAVMQQLHALSRERGISLCAAAAALAEAEETKPKMRTTLRAFVTFISRWREMLREKPHADVARVVLDESGYTLMWQQDKSPDAPARLENLKELVNAMAEFDTLEAFLEHVSLVMEATERDNVPQVSVMTLHGAKGLEFDCVFLPGWEEELFPSKMSLQESGERGLEEERRLAYVGITRARRRLWISHASRRQVYGGWQARIPSRFIAELPTSHVDRGAMAGNFGAYANEGRIDPAPPPLWQQIGAAARQGAIEGQSRRIAPPPAAPPDGGQELKAGDRVFHQQFGLGVVARRIDKTKLEIAFAKAGMKKVVQDFVERK